MTPLLSNWLLFALRVAGSIQANSQTKYLQCGIVKNFFLIIRQQCCLANSKARKKITKLKIQFIFTTYTLIIHQHKYNKTHTLAHLHSLNTYTHKQSHIHTKRMKIGHTARTNVTNSLTARWWIYWSYTYGFVLVLG